MNGVIEQQLAELGNVIEECTDRFAMRIHELESECSRLRSALEFYASEQTWNQWLSNAAGDIARQALAADPLTEGEASDLLTQLRHPGRA